MTLVAGQLLMFGWRIPFLVYEICFIILFMYIGFVPKTNNGETMVIHEQPADVSRVKMTLRQLIFIITNAVFIGLLIATNVSNALRIPSYIIENNIGTAIISTNILSISMFTGEYPKDCVNLQTDVR